MKVRQSSTFLQDWPWSAFVGILIVLGLGYAWIFRHVEDDAFITFRYSQHLAEGFGPVWNPGERVEGYSNPLWMILMAIPHWVGIDPVLPSQLLAMAAMALNLWVLYRLSTRQAGSQRTGFWAWLPLAFCHTLLIFSTSGMETSLNALFWTLALYQLQGQFRGAGLPSVKRLVLLGVTVGFATLSRMEGMLLGLVVTLSLAAMVFLTRHRGYARILAFMGGWMALVLPWLAWRYGYYGDLLPNTYYIKAGAGTMMDGLRYGAIFLAASGIWIAWLFEISARKPRRFDTDVPAMVFALLAAGFFLYTVLVGGDYMEFRFLSPVLPFIIMLPTWRLDRKARHTWQLPAAAISMAFLAIVWGQGYGRVVSLAHLNPIIHHRQAGAHHMSFRQQGEALGHLLDHDPTIRLAIGACGAIPYYSRFYGIDLFGLNEPHRFFRGYETGFGAGHARLADWPYICERKPHLISIRCDYLPDLQADRTYSVADPNFAIVLHGAKLDTSFSENVVELPLGDGFVEVCIYHENHPAIDALIKSKSLKIYPLEKK